MIERVFSNSIAVTPYGNHPASEPSDAHKITSDPLLAGAGSGGIGLSSVNGYKLGTGSPALSSGVLMSSNGGKDYWGNTVSSSIAPNRGAYNGAGIVLTTPNTWNAVDDANVRDGTYATTNQAGTTAVTVDTKNDLTSYKRDGYFKFDFNSYSGTVSNATITLKPIIAAMSGIQNEVALVSDNTWTEGAITWNTKPSSSTVLGTYTIVAGTPITINVTSQVQAAMSTGKKLSIRVYSTSAVNSNGNVSFASSESIASTDRPKLTITP